MYFIHLRTAITGLNTVPNPRTLLESIYSIFKAGSDATTAMIAAHSHSYSFLACFHA